MYLKLEDKLNYVKNTLAMPHHFFTLTSDRSEVLLYIEDNSGKRFKFRGKTMYDTTTEAEQYVRAEVKKGILKELVEDENDEDIMSLDEDSPDLSGTTPNETDITDIDKKEKVIKTEEDYHKTLKLVEILIAKDPDFKSQEGKQLRFLASLVMDYESKLSSTKPLDTKELEK